MMAALIALAMALALLAISKISPIWNGMMSPAESALHVGFLVVLIVVYFNRKRWHRQKGDAGHFAAS